MGGFGKVLGLLCEEEGFFPKGSSAGGHTTLFDKKPVEKMISCPQFGKIIVIGEEGKRVALMVSDGRPWGGHLSIKSTSGVTGPAPSHHQYELYLYPGRSNSARTLAIFLLSHCCVVLVRPPFLSLLIQCAGRTGPASGGQRRAAHTSQAWCHCRRYHRHSSQLFVGFAHSGTNSLHPR